MADMADRADWADRADRADMADRADRADMTDRADRAGMAGKSEIMNDPLTGPQHQLLEDAIASKNKIENTWQYAQRLAEHKNASYPIPGPQRSTW